MKSTNCLVSHFEKTLKYDCESTTMTAKRNFVASWVALAILPTFGFLPFVHRHYHAAKILLSAATETEEHLMEIAHKLSLQV
jgi:hypothetical protein